VQALIEALKALFGDVGQTYTSMYVTMGLVAFLLVFILLLSAIIRIIDRR